MPEQTVQGRSPVQLSDRIKTNSDKYLITKTTNKPNTILRAGGRPSDDSKMTDDSMTGQRELGATSRTVGPESCLSAFKPLIVSTYNVRTIYQKGKIHQLFSGCADAGIDIAGIQEHRLITTNSTDELWSDDKNFVMIYSTATQQRQGGVGLLMSKHIYKCLQGVKVISKRILSATFYGNPQLSIYHIIVYAPDQVRRHNINLVLGDFNARVGLDSHSSRPVVVGRHCFYDTTNANGERLVNLCEEHNMRIAHTIFPHPRGRTWTWTHPGGSLHQLDHILINSKWVNSLRNCRAYNSVELDSDHRIVSITLKTSLRTSKGKPCKRPKFNWKKLQDPATREEFQLELSNRFNALKTDNTSTITERYREFETTVKEVAEKVVGKCKPCGMPSWVSEATKKLKVERDQAKIKYSISKSRHSREIWRNLNNRLNKSYQDDESTALSKQIDDLKRADEIGDYTTTWKIINDLSGKNSRQNIKVKKRDGSDPSSENELLAEWGEYFSSILNNENGPPSSELPLPSAIDLPIPTGPPSREETVEAISAMKTNKAAGLDCAITAESLQAGGDSMVDMIHDFCVEVYTTASPPDQWTTNVIVPLPKKGDLSLMTNYRGITLMSIAAKVYNKILLNRIRSYIDPILRSNQAGFRPGRSCAQQIHILRRIMEGFRDHQLPLVVTFIDFKKAFDSINRRVMFCILRHYGIPAPVVNAIQALYKNTRSAVLVDGNLSDTFDVTTGVLQGDVLAPFLFIIVVDYLLSKVTAGTDVGVETHPRRSRRYPAKLLNDLDFADDISLLESAIPRAQTQLTNTASEADVVGLIINIPKTEYMTVNCGPHTPLKVYGSPIKQVDDFRYLGSMMANSANDFKRRKALAWSAFWKLEHLWRKPSLPIATKVKLFNTTCVTILLYGCESWVISKDMENKINAFATSCYRIMLNIKRTDRVPNSTIYNMTNTSCLIERVRTQQLKFLGHILRMPDDEPVKLYALYAPSHGRKRPGRQHTSYLTYIQHLFGDYDGMLSTEQLVTLAQDRSKWRKLVVDCSAAEG